MEGKYCIVTGANSGIGYEVARGLMQQGAHVIMACRNQEACSAAACRLSSLGLPGSCACRHLDLEDPASVRAFARQQAEELAQQQHQQPCAHAANAISGSASGSAASGSNMVAPGDGASSTGPRSVDVLVNNAGVMGVGPGPHGEDRHFTANHLGPFLLTRLLLPLMTRGSRVVNVSSRAHYWGALQLDAKEGAMKKCPDKWWLQYSRSKLANVVFTAELRRRHAQQDGLLAFAVSPGLVRTSIFRYFPLWMQWLVQPLAATVMLSPEQGAATVLYAASDPSLTPEDEAHTQAAARVAGGRLTSLFLHAKQPKQPLDVALDPQLGADLWSVSSVMVGLPCPEKH